jgi:FlaA1/EpsC-like NDP-sugar epimerase
LFLGDVAALYAALLLTLLVRYGSNFYAEFLANHFLPFTIIFALWVVVFYVAGLYDFRHLRNNIDFLKILGVALSINFVFAVFFFYLVLAFGITPKTNLFVFLLVFAFIEFFWRRRVNKAISSGEAPNKVVLVGGSENLRPIEELEILAPDWLKQLGYEIVARIG